MSKLLPSSQDRLLCEFLQLQRQSLLREFHESKNCLVAASLDKLDDFLDPFFGWTMEVLPNTKYSSARVIWKQGATQPECWARWNYKNYRKAFATFLGLYFPKFEYVIDQTVQVDHLESKLRFSKAETHFVRLHIVRREVNASFGAGFERSFYNRERTKPLRSATEMNWLMFCKANGILPPGKNTGSHTWELWARHHATIISKDLAEPEDVVVEGLLDVLRLGYTGFYSGKNALLGSSLKMVSSLDMQHLHENHRFNTFLQSPAF